MLTNAEMETKKILLTNDDGPKSPFLVPLARALSALPEVSRVHVVVPAEEQSWIGQAVTRFRPLYLTDDVIDGQPIKLVSGTPADCVGLGLFNLFDTTFDFVISGINFGTNASLPFYLNSGTVGAARQALTFGVRGIALSALIPEQLFRAWREDELETLRPLASEWERLASVCAGVAQKLFADPCWADVDLYSVNVPWEVTDSTEVVLTQLERGRYKPLYVLREGNCYTHQFHGFHRPPMPGTEEIPTDFQALDVGKISLTPVRYDTPTLSESTLGHLGAVFK